MSAESIARELVDELDRAPSCILNSEDEVCWEELDDAHQLHVLFKQLREDNPDRFDRVVKSVYGRVCGASRSLLKNRRKVKNHSHPLVKALETWLKEVRRVVIDEWLSGNSADWTPAMTRKRIADVLGVSNSTIKRMLRNDQLTVCGSRSRWKVRISSKGLSEEQREALRKVQ